VRRFSIARSLLAALLGLALALACLAVLALAGLYGARQDYEDSLVRSYSAQVAGADLVTASVLEETTLRSARSDADARARVAAIFDRAAQVAGQSAEGDPVSVAAVTEQVGAQQRARTAAVRLRAARSRRASAAALAELREATGTGRSAASRLSTRQDARRAEARRETQERSKRATVTAAVAGGLGLGAALVIVFFLVGRLREPLARLVTATQALAAGDLDARVQVAGPAELQDLGVAFNAMADDLGGARRRIEENRRQLAAIIASLGDALVICDAIGRVIDANPRAAELVPTLITGHNVAKDPGPLPELEEALGHEVEVVEGERTLAVTAARLGPGPNEGVVWTIRDVTERARLEQAKSDFVATASHELRSPLTSIKGFVELLGKTELAERQREFVDIVALSTNRLVDLVNDLLDAARVEAGQLELQRRPIAVAEAIHEVTALLRPRLDQRRQQLTLEIAPALPSAFGDPTRIRQIVTNLMTNAHLYTGEGGSITVRAGATAEHVSIAVADTGRGMAPAVLERIFERFYRGGRDGHGGGTGLGLSIVRSLVELHDGEIDVISEEGEGTTFTVRIPRAPEAAELDEPRQAVRGKRVLVIEDEPEVARLIAEQLTPFGVEAIVVHTGEDAIRRLKLDSFDAVTLDILLGGVDGFEVLRIIRDDPKLRRTPVVVVSVYAGEDTLAGEWVVAKPIDAEELADALGSAILAGRSRVLVVARASMREVVGGALERRGIEFAWATSGSQAARLCEETHFEVALVDAGMRSPQAALAALDLRGRRLRRSVVVFSAGDDGPGIATLGADPVPVEDATAAVVGALRSSAEAESTDRLGP